MGEIIQSIVSGVGIVINGGVLLFILFIPLYVTARNVRRLFRFSMPYRLVDDLIVFVLGIPLTLIIIPDTPWNEPIVVNDQAFHAPASFDFTIVVIGIVSFFCYAVLRAEGRVLPPIPRTCALTGMYVGSIYAVLWIVQLSENLFVDNPYAVGSNSLYGIMFGRFVFFDFMAMLFAFNYLLLTARMVIDHVKISPRVWPTYKNPLLNLASRFLARCGTLPVAALVVLFPLCLLLLAILALFGQQPHVLINCFRDTSDWFFSIRVSPPPLDDGGHYLCTVAARGDRRLVKPLRPGIRHGFPIVVNRQLCVANAFEELLAESLPRFHRFVRRNYDKYGLSVCRYIDKPWKADLVYLFMKPAEWLFALVLYTFDTEPERRIARQYVPSELLNI